MSGFQQEHGNQGKTGWQEVGTDERLGCDGNVDKTKKLHDTIWSRTSNEKDIEEP